MGIRCTKCSHSKEVHDNKKNRYRIVDPQPVTEATNTFGFTLYRELLKKNENRNVFYSPYSVSTAMSMLTLGSKSMRKSKSELVQTLALENIENFQTEIQKLRQAIIKPIDGVDLTTANSLFPELTYEVKKDFISQVKQYYGADVTPLSFKTKAEESRKAINKWVSRETKDKIQDLLTEGSIQADTKLVLVNAIYFKGNWDTPFDKAQTVDNDFHVTLQKVTKVKMMTREAEYNLKMDEKLKASILEIPYKGNSTTMVIVLPEDKFGLELVEKNIKPIDVQNANASFKQEVFLRLPKFKLKFASDLVKPFQALGTKNIFSGNADFSKISDSKDLYVSSIAHKAFVEVNEEGTEAAAATAPVVVFGCSDEPMPPFQFVCDHPFMFFIKHKLTDTILFAGRFVNPDQ